MNEAQFNSEVVQSFIKAGAWAYKIPDVPISQTRGMSYLPKKPCDIIGCYGRTFFAVECKQIKEFKAFGPNALRPNQKDALDAVVAQGARGFVFLNIRIAPSKRKGLKRENRLLIFDWAGFRECKSYKKAEISQLPFIKGVKGIFDLEDVLMLEL